MITDIHISPPESLAYEKNMASRLLRSQEDIPVNVQNLISFCTENKIGYVLSRNQFAGSCRDARQKRYRLGHVGIPLSDELKSIVGKTVDESGKEIVVAMHCRGDKEIDFLSVQRLLGGRKEVKPLTDEDLLEKLQVRFGTVNPVTLNINSQGSLLQIFDTGVEKPVLQYPGTMMTNAGDHYWGIEFDVTQVIYSIENSKMASIAIQDRDLSSEELIVSSRPKSIGIITGNGPDSGMALWRSVNNYIASILGDYFFGDMSLPEVHIVSLPAMGLSMELDKREAATWHVLSTAVETLKQQNVDLLALACHTTHYFERYIRRSFDSPSRRFISMPETVMAYLHREKIRDVAILGIQYVADLGKWSAYTPMLEQGVSIESLEADIMKRFHDIGYNIKQMGDVHKSFQQLISLIKYQIKSDNVIIALTELSVLLTSSGKKSRQSDKNIIDALDLYAQAIAKESLGLNWNIKKGTRGKDYGD